MEGYTIQAFIRQINTPHGSCGEASPQPAALIFFPSIFASGIRRRRLGSSRRGTEADQETTLVSDYRDGRTTIRSLIFFFNEDLLFFGLLIDFDGPRNHFGPRLQGRTDDPIVDLQKPVYESPTVGCRGCIEREIQSERRSLELTAERAGTYAWTKKHFVCKVSESHRPMPTLYASNCLHWSCPHIRERYTAT
jgi:hypothetical protein